MHTSRHPVQYGGPGRAPAAPTGAAARIAGTVKFFNEAKGFGFITPDDGGRDVFVHISAVKHAGLDELREGDRVSFVVGTNARSGKDEAQKLQRG